MIIGISGKKQCGKDTICSIIQALDLYYDDNVVTAMGDIEFVLGYLSEKFEVLKACIDPESLVEMQSKWEKHAFADKLKAALGVILDTHRSNFEEETFKSSYSSIVNPAGGNYTIRELLQKFGTEAGRAISPNLWVDALMTNYRRQFQRYVEYGTLSDGSRTAIGMNRIEPHWIVPDVRFPNEAKAIKEHGGILLRVNRDTGYNDTHASEIALDNYSGFDYVIDNCDLEGTIIKVRDILRDNNLI